MIKNISSGSKGLKVPFFKEITVNARDKHSFTTTVENFDEKNIYLEDVFLNSKKFNRHWVTNQEIQKDGILKNHSFGHFHKIHI